MYQFSRSVLEWLWILLRILNHSLDAFCNHILRRPSFRSRMPQWTNNPVYPWVVPWTPLLPRKSFVWPWAGRVRWNWARRQCRWADWYDRGCAGTIWNFEQTSNYLLCSNYLLLRAISEIKLNLQIRGFCRVSISCSSYFLLKQH